MTQFKFESLLTNVKIVGTEGTSPGPHTKLFEAVWYHIPSSFDLLEPSNLPIERSNPIELDLFDRINDAYHSLILVRCFCSRLFLSPMRPTPPASNFLARLHHGHERLKKTVHEGMRVPLPKWGQRVMGFVYFCTPIIGGYNVIQWAIGWVREYLPNKQKPVGSLSSTNMATAPSYGVPLASSDKEIQQRKKEKLQQYL